MSIVELTNENFEETVLKAEKPVLVDFWAEWCGPCRMMSPIIDELAEEGLDIVIGKVNVDQQPDLARKYEVESIPTLVYFQSGRVMKNMIGLRTKEDILKEIL